MKRASTEFRVGVRSAPYLADHGFQQMIVLPGSLYMDMALRMDRKRSTGGAAVIRNVTFHNPIILSADDTVVRADVRDQGDGRVEYTFYEAGAGEGRHAAKLEIERNGAITPGSAEPFSVADFQERSQAVIAADRFYDQLLTNGNQYGPRFQRVISIWRAGDESLGRLSAARRDGDTEPHGVLPSLLDATTQLLASFIMEQGKTFILKSIEKVELVDAPLPETLWGHAVLATKRASGDDGLVGHVRVVDQLGRPYLALSGVAFSVLDGAHPPSLESAADAPALHLAIASNFTAEPVEDTLRFWGDHFGVPVHLEFAPYNQVFQQLLDAASAFRRNRDRGGVNVVLLGLEEWATTDRHGTLTLGKDKADQTFGDRPRYVLPNGLEIVHLNQYETDYVYKEIFEDQCYLKHGIRLHDGATVVDIGANIGLFSLFVMSRCKNPAIYAFEPASAVFDLLQANCAAYGSQVRAVNAGVADRPKTAPLTFYENSSVFSSFHADETEDREAIQAVVRNTLTSEASIDGEAVEEYVSELTADRLRRTTVECPMTSVSAIIREHKIEKIDLLKIDAERSELDIIEGIEERDWPKIAQIVIEIHDRTEEAVRQVRDLLIAKGYRCTVDHERLLERSGLFNLYATRLEGATPVVAVGSSLRRNTQDFCTALRAFMDQAKAPLVVACCPRTPAAQSDLVLTAALNDAEQALLATAATIPNARAIPSGALQNLYPVAQACDPYSHQAGHIPYTAEAYAAIGTALFRTVFSLKRQPFKVIVLDCDNTLWKGVCGEDGPLGVEVSPPYRALQEFMVEQMRAGMLLCLCSKNDEADVLDVFDRRTDMVLQREHIVSQRINWNSKSDNLKSLARELNVGLDSFIFIDDNPVECADVRINCPGVLTLQLPRDSEAFPAFLHHVWAFDRTGPAGASEEDQDRTRMYQENSEREKFRERAFSLKDFVKGLELQIEIAEVTDDQIGRVSQLTFRTNQFNFSGVRRSESEIRDFLKRERAKGLAVRVVDRFGDYGLVGVVLYETQGDRYKVDTFLLSCRVLGRGVEHVVLAHLGNRAVAEGIGFVELTYRPTDKNLPALEFVRSLGGGGSATFAAERLAQLEYDPDHTRETPPPEAPSPQSGERGERGGRGAAGFRVADQAGPLQRIAEGLRDVTRVAQAVEEYRLRRGPGQGAVDVAPDDGLQAALLNIWRRVLGRPRVGLNDNFFEVGGTSLRAVQVIAAIKKELQQSLSIVTLFECPTVALLAAKLGAAPGEPSPPGAASASGAELRGRQRRMHVVRRRAS